MSFQGCLISAVVCVSIFAGSATARALPVQRAHVPPQHVRIALPAPTFGGLTISRLDQSSRYAIVRNVRPGGRVELYANGYLVATAYPRANVVRMNFTRALVPGSRVAVAERFATGAIYGRAFTTVQTNYTTYHFDNARTGWNPFEQALTVRNVRTQFGKLFTMNLDGDMLAQPLYVGGLTIGSQGVHNVLFAATEADSVFAFDADNGAPLWSTSLVNPGAGFNPVPIGDVGTCKNISPTVGVTSTPVIDTSTNTMYVVAKLQQIVAGQKSWHQMLHALDITTGLDQPGSPVEIGGTITSGGNVITFDPRWELNRIGLLLSNGVVYVGFGSHCDFHGPMARGWIFGYSASDLSQVAEYVSTGDLNEGFGAFWASGFAFSTDSQGNIYAVTGNGAYDGAISFGDSVMKFAPNLTLMDAFTPYDYQTLDDGDTDLGSGGVMVIPQQGGAFPDMVVQAGKSRNIYLMNQHDLGGLTPGGPDRVVQMLPEAIGREHGVWGGPAYYVDPIGQPYIFYCGGQDSMKAFALLTSPSTMLMQTTHSVTKFVGEGGTIPVVSSNGTTPGTGIVWAINRPTHLNLNIRLIAFDATNLGKRLITLPAGTYDNPKGGYFGVPTVIAGKVYVGTGRAIAAFGLNP